MNRIKRIYFEELASTNDYAKSVREGGEDLIVVAKRQTGGRGTKGRSFDSTDGGLYFTKLTFYKNTPANGAFTIMQSAAAAVCETLSTFGLKPKIKWPNDILVNGKKICGILIENQFVGKEIRSSVVGIGLNVCNRLPAELLPIATTIYAETGKTVAVDEVEKCLTENLARADIADEYTAYLGWIGEEVLLLVGETAMRVTVLRVDETGRLIALCQGEEKHFSAGEISLRVEG